VQLLRNKRQKRLIPARYQKGLSSEQADQSFLIWRLRRLLNFAETVPKSLQNEGRLLLPGMALKTMRNFDKL